MSKSYTFEIDEVSAQATGPLNVLTLIRVQLAIQLSIVERLDRISDVLERSRSGPPPDWED